MTEELLQAPPVVADQPAAIPVTDGAPWQHNDLVFRQKILSLGKRIQVFDREGRLIYFVKQKAFRLREDIRLYGDEAMREEKLLIRAHKIHDFNAAFEVVDPVAGVSLGGLRRKGWSSMIKDEWQIFDPVGKQIGSILEDSMALALVRRFLSGLVPQSHQFLVGGRPVGEFRQRFNPLVFKAEFSLQSELAGSLDPHLALAGAVLLMAIEGRQGDS